MATCKDCFHYELCKRIDYELEYHNKSIKEAEEELPIKCRFFKNKADVVPVVRCKDCRYFITDVFNRTMCNRTFTMFEMNENDYCSYGERKD